MSWLFITLLSAFCLASADAVAKKYLSSYRADALVVIRFAMPGILLLPLLLYIGIPDLELAFWGWVALVIPLEIIAMTLYSMAIRDTSLSLTLPYFAFTPVFNILPGYLILGEQVALVGVAGILLVVAGAWLLNIEHARGGDYFDVIAPFKAIIRERGSRFMLIAAMLYSVGAVVGKAALAYTTPLFFGTFYYVLLGSVVLMIFTFRGGNPARLLAKNVKPHIWIGVLMAIMVIAHFMAIQHIEVAYMIAVKRTSLLFGIVYSVILFHEKARADQFIAGGLMVTGVYLVALS
jgi:drug/metabolite transporter (DMT)-like permease